MWIGKNANYSIYKQGSLEKCTRHQQGIQNTRIRHLPSLADCERKAMYTQSSGKENTRTHLLIACFD